MTTQLALTELKAKKIGINIKLFMIYMCFYLYILIQILLKQHSYMSNHD